MMQPLEHRRLAVEAVDALGRGAAVQQLEGHARTGGGIHGLIDSTHAAPPRQPLDLEASGEHRSADQDLRDRVERMRRRLVRIHEVEGNTITPPASDFEREGLREAGMSDP